MTDAGKIDRREFLGLGCSLAATVALAGCSPAPRSAGQIDVVMTQGMSGLVVHEVTRAQGYFEKFDVDPNILLVSDGGKCVAALLSGAAQICMWSGFNQVLSVIERGADIKIVAGALNLPSLAFYTSRDDIQSVADLEGKAIGIGALGSVLHQMTMLALRKHGVGLDTVQFQNIGSNADVFKAVVAGTVDAGLSDVEMFGQQQKYGVHALPDGLLWKEIPEFTNQGSYTTGAALQTDRDTMVRLLAAYGSAYRYISGPASKQAFIAARQVVTGVKETELSTTAWNWIQEFQPYALNLTLSDDQINYVQDLNIDFKVQRQVLPISQVADMSLARGALRLMG